MPDPVSWKVMERGWRVFDASGKEIGKVDVIRGLPEDDIFVMHKVPFPAGILHVENRGGDIDRAERTRIRLAQRTRLVACLAGAL